MVTIVLHCSDSHFGNAALIAKWHLARGWQGIGYHYVILNGWLSAKSYHPCYNGHIETGRALNSDSSVSPFEVGAHVKGHNAQSVGICLIGRSGVFTDEQLNAALSIVYQLERQFGEIRIVQHSELDGNKPECAGLDMVRFQANLRRYKWIINSN